MGEKKIKISKYTANYRFKTQARYLQEIKKYFSISLFS